MGEEERSVVISRAERVELALRAQLKKKVEQKRVDSLWTLCDRTSRQSCEPTSLYWTR